MEDRDIQWHEIGEARYVANHFLAEGEVKVVAVNGSKYCLGRLADGYHALRNQCPHASGSLGHGKCDEEGNVICPNHRMKFDLKTGKNTSGEGYFVEPYPVKQEDDRLYIGLPKRKWFGFW